MPRECGRNTVLLFRVRGSGENYGNDKLGQWAYVAGTTLLRGGNQVRDMQAIYSANEVPFLDPRLLKAYRDVVTREWPSVRDQLEAAHVRCRARTILVAGYSQGALMLRYVIRGLSAEARGRIAGVYLVGDPTADRNVDHRIQHPPQIDGRLTDMGVDTASGRLIWGSPVFRQKPYPDDVRGRVFQICGAEDLVCNFDYSRFADPWARKRSNVTHSGYAWGAYGAHAAKQAAGRL
jgi:hypothetical protein